MIKQSSEYCRAGRRRYQAQADSDGRLRRIPRLNGDFSSRVKIIGLGLLAYDTSLTLSSNICRRRP